MKNPYTILCINQDAERAEIKKAQMVSMQKKEYSLQEIHLAANQLLNPAKRLAADFLFPSKIKVKRLKPIYCDFKFKEVAWDEIDKDALNSI